MCIISKFISVELVDTGILCILGVDENEVLFTGGSCKHHVMVTSLKLV